MIDPRSTRAYKLGKENRELKREIELLERQIKIKDKWCWRIWADGVDYDGCGNNSEELRRLVDELVDYSIKAINSDDKSFAYTCYENEKVVKFNILLEEIEDDKE